MNDQNKPSPLQPGVQPGPEGLGETFNQPGPEGPGAGMSGRGLNPAPRSAGDPPRPLRGQEPEKASSQWLAPKPEAQESGRGFPLLDETRIDLGDDLLEKTAVIPGAPLKSPPQTSSNRPDSANSSASPLANPFVFHEDQLQSAQILLGEGLTEDAKKVLHHLLIQDPDHLPARQLLDKIHELELKQLFGDGEVRRPYRKKAEPVAAIDSEEIMRKLDADLGLGVFADSSREASLNQLSLFQDEKAMEQFGEQIVEQFREQFQGSSAQDWIDLGIGFLEMDLYSIAARLFSEASHKVDIHDVDTPESHTMSISAVSLLALALILAKRPFEAISKIQPILHDVEVKLKDKIELLYLMGRTYESIGKSDQAFSYYQQVTEIDPKYRDIEQRLPRKNMR